MTKGVANFWRYAEVAHAANGRLLTALARVPLTGEATVELDALCRPGTAAGTRVAAFNPIHPDTAALFAAVLSGDFTINGFRNRDLQGKLYPAAATDVADAKRRTHRTSRLIAKLRGWPHHPGQEQSALSPHRPRSQGHVACRSLPSYRLSQRLPGCPSRIETSALMSIPGEELHTTLCDFEDEAKPRPV